MKFAKAFREKTVRYFLAKQDGKCAICGDKLSYINRDRRTCLDHCHKTEKIRGLLCRNCNIGLGNFKDSIPLLINAISYLTKAKHARRQVSILDTQSSFEFEGEVQEKIPPSRSKVESDTGIIANVG